MSIRLSQLYVLVSCFQSILVRLTQLYVFVCLLFGQQTQIRLTSNVIPIVLDYFFYLLPRERNDKESA